MYGGHLGFALAGRSGDEDLPLAVLIPAAFAPDLLSLGLLLSGAFAPETVPGSGSVGTTLVLALAVGLVGGWRFERASAGVVLGLLVVSHALGDLLEQSVPLWPGGPDAGLGLGGLPVLDHGLQLGIIVLGWVLYRRSVSGPGSEPIRPEVWAVLAVAVGLHLASVVIRVASG